MSLFLSQRIDDVERDDDKDDNSNDFVLIEKNLILFLLFIYELFFNEI